MDQKEYVSYSVMINGIEVNAVYSRESMDGICLDHSGSADLTLEMTGDGEYKVAVVEA